MRHQTRQFLNPIHFYHLGIQWSRFVAFIVTSAFFILISTNTVSAEQDEPAVAQCACPVSSLAPIYQLLLDDTASVAPDCPVPSEPQQCGACETLETQNGCQLGACMLVPERAVPDAQQALFNCNIELCGGGFRVDDTDISADQAVCKRCDNGDLVDKPDGSITPTDNCQFCQQGLATKLIAKLTGPELVCPSESYQYGVSINLQGQSAVWSGEAAPSGLFTAPASAADGDSFSLIARVQQCRQTKVVTASDGQPGSTSETAACFSDPFRCLSVRGLSDEANNWANNNPNRFGGGTGGGCADAARHAYFNAIGVMDIGAAAIQRFSDAHEFSNLNGCNDNNMDLINNHIGRDLGAQCRDRACAQQAVVNALKQGQLTVWSGNARDSGTLVSSEACNVSI